LPFPIMISSISYIYKEYQIITIIEDGGTIRNISVLTIGKNT